MRLYRALLHLYPRAFRREYADDMVLLLERQLRDEGAGRVAARTLVDLAITVPTRHLEAHMNRSSTTALVVVLAAIGISLAVIGGPIGLLAGLGVLTLAGVAFTRGRPVAAPADGRWWKLLLGGVALLGAIAGITTITGEVPEGAWLIVMVGLLSSFLLIAAGIVLGIASRFRPASV